MAKSIEKAFAIAAPPAAIWDALWSEVQSAEVAAGQVVEAHKPQLLSVEARIGGIEVRMTYRIQAGDVYSEVVASLEPISPKYGLYQLLTFGHLRRNYELLLVQGLANLKEALENGAGETWTAPDQA
jgi:hypothetical protein